ncbi:MAG: hypothetical protein ACRDF6_03840, partial [bacterium]
MNRPAVILALASAALLAVPGPARAGGSTDAALALGAFAVLNQLVRGDTILHDVFRPQRVVVQQPPVVVQPPPVIYAPPPPVVYAPPPVVYYQYPAAVVYNAPPAHYYP